MGRRKKGLIMRAPLSISPALEKHVELTVIVNAGVCFLTIHSHALPAARKYYACYLNRKNAHHLKL